MEFLARFIRTRTIGIAAAAIAAVTAGGHAGCGGPGEPRARKTPPPQAACDPVSCALGNHRGACCRTAPDPDALDRGPFDATMATVEPAAARCTLQYPHSGYFPVAVTVDPGGRVTDVGKPRANEGWLDPHLLACVAAAVRTGQFGPSRHGGTLTYVFEFHASR
jgi:hypothetical protein